MILNIIVIISILSAIIFMWFLYQFIKWRKEENKVIDYRKWSGQNELAKAIAFQQSVFNFYATYCPDNCKGIIDSDKCKECDIHKKYYPKKTWYRQNT